MNEAKGMRKTMKEKKDFIAVLEEYKQLFTDFFCDPKPRCVKVTRSFAIGEEKEILPTFTLEKNELQNDGGVNFAINSINLWYISDMKKDGKKIKIYSHDFLVGIFYLPKQIQLEFLITWINQPYLNMVDIHAIWFYSKVEKEKEKKDYELKVLPKREGSLRVRIKIRTRDYKKNIERILFYGKIYSYLEIIFEEEVGSVPLCINGLYLFGVSRIKLDEGDIELFLRLKKEQSQKEYRIHIWYEEKQIEIYKKYGIIYLVCPFGDSNDKDIDMKFLSTKENLRLGHSIYR